MRIILYSGKGGVGKTSVAAATALRCADLGLRTLVMSTDLAGNLGDLFEMGVGARPTPVAPNLWAQETRQNDTVNRQWGVIREWLSALIAQSDIPELLAEEIAVLPGMEEMANLLDLVRYTESGEYDVIVLDCAPTGETLRLLSFPEVLEWWLRKLSPQNKVLKVGRRLLQPLLDTLAVDDELVETGRGLIRQLALMRQLLTDPQTTSVRLVLNPEKLAVKETQRAFTYLNLYGYRTDCVICNRCYPESAGDGYLRRWKSIQDRYYDETLSIFSSLPVIRVPLLEQEIVGQPMLRSLAAALHDGRRPTDFLAEEPPYYMGKNNGHYMLSFSLPNTSRDEISVERSDGDELIVCVGDYRRNIMLPSSFAKATVSSARFEGNNLVIKFEKPRRTGQQPELKARRPTHDSR